MGWWWLPVSVVGLAALDRLALMAEARGWLYWRRTGRHGGGGGGSAIGELIEVFQPSRAFTVEETERRRLDIAQHGSEGPSLGVDLEAGVAFVPGTTSEDRPTATEPSADGSGPSPEDRPEPPA
jgi:hypothetical protein